MPNVANKLLTIALAGAFPTISSAQIDAIAQSGDAAPGVAGAVFETFGTPLINDQHDVAVIASISGAGIDATNDTGLWVRRSGNWMLVAREGDQAPGAAAGVLLGEFFPFGVIIDASGRVAFDAALTGPGVTDTNDTGVWTDVSGTLELVVREGDPVPDRTSPALTVRENSFSNVGFDCNMDDAGRILIQITYDGGAPPFGAEDALLSWQGGVLETVFVDQEAAPTSGFWGLSNARTIEMNNAGEIAFLGSSYGGLPADALWAGTFNASILSILAGSLAPGLPPGVAVDSLFDQVRLTPGGRIVMQARLNPATTGGTDADRVLYAGFPDALDVIAWEGQAAPEEPGLSYGSVSFLSAINDAGQIAFRTEVRGAGVNSSNDRALWGGPTTAPRIVAREGMQAPGTDAGVTFTNFSTNGTPGLNESGLLVFSTTLAGPGVDASNNNGIWLADLNDGGMPQLLLRNGNVVDADAVGGPISETLDDFEYLPSKWRTRTGLSNQDALVLTALWQSGGQAILLFDDLGANECPGDANDDDQVDFDDLNVVLIAWGDCGVIGEVVGDVTLDGCVDFNDLNAVLSNWLATCN